MSGLLENKIALITGTGGGQGRAAALRFAAQGARVVGCDLDAEGHAETVGLVAAQGGTMHGLAPLDLGDDEAARRFVAEGMRLHGRIDVLYNNASAARFGPIHEMSVEDWRFTLRNELDLVFFVTRHAWRHLAEQGGVILNTASVAGLVGSRKSPMVAHAATKGGVIAMSRQLAIEGAASGIRVNCISPGVIETPGTADIFANPEVSAALLAENLLPRAGQPAEVADLAVFLASDAAGFITGANFVIDGGMTAS